MQPELQNNSRVHLLRLALIIIVTALVVFILATQNVSAQDPADITIVRSGAESQFPEGMTFFLDVESDVRIDDVRVVFTVGDRGTNTYSYLELEYVSEALTNGEFYHRTNSRDRYIPPGTTITFFFEITDETGYTHVTDPETFRFDDARYVTLEGLFAEHDSRKPEFAVVTARTTCHHAAVFNPRSARVTRHLGDCTLSFILLFEGSIRILEYFNEVPTRFRVFCDELHALLVLGDFALLCHVFCSPNLRLLSVYSRQAAHHAKTRGKMQPLLGEYFQFRCGATGPTDDSSIFWWSVLAPIGTQIA